MEGTDFAHGKTDLKLNGNQLKIFYYNKCCPVIDPVDFFFFWTQQLLCKVENQFLIFS